MRILVNLRWTSLLLSSFFITAAEAAPGDKIELVRDLAGRVGPVIGSALACPDITRPRIQSVIEKFAAVIRDAASNEAQRSDLAQLFDRSVADGRGAVTSGRTDCRLAERRLADLEQSLAPSAPAPAAAAPSRPRPRRTGFRRGAGAPAPAISFGNPVSAVRGISDTEIRFGITAAFTGPVRERGRQMKLGIETAFNQVNDAGGIAGRKLRIIAADDGNEPARTLQAVRQLYEKDQIFGIIGSIGTATAAVAVPFALERRMLFFGAYTGGNVVRRDPPDRYVFNYRPSYAEEADAAVRYLVKMRRIPIRQIAVFAQTDDLGDAGYAGVAKAYRAMGLNDSAILRLNYPRNTIEVDEAVNTLRVQKVPVRAIIMSASYRAAAKFIEKTRALYPEMIFTSISGVGGSSLAEELKLLGPTLYGRGPCDPGRAGGVRIFERGARIQECAGEIFSRRGARLRVAGRFCCSQHPDRRDQARRPAVRYRKAGRYAGERPAISIWASACRSISAAPNTPPRKRSGARRSTRAAVSSRSTWNSRQAGQRLSMTRLCTARPK